MCTLFRQLTSVVDQRHKPLRSFPQVMQISIASLARVCQGEHGSDHFLTDAAFFRKTIWSGGVARMAKEVVRSSPYALDGHLQVRQWPPELTP